MSFSAIVVSHQNEQGLRKMLGNLMYQTRKPDETIVLVSGLRADALAEIRLDFPHADFHAREDLDDWGHQKRSEGLELSGCDWVGFFNDDDTYALDYVEKMLLRAEGHDVAFCSWNTIPNCNFSLGSSTSGNYIVRRELAKDVGYHSRRYEADGDFIEALKSAGANVAPRVDEILYHHNWQQ